MAKKTIDVKIRPLANASLEKGSLSGAANIYINKDSYIALTGSSENGKLCILERIDDDQPEGAAPTLRREALLCVLSDKNVSPNVAMMSRSFQDASGFKTTDKARIILSDNTAPAEATEVVVRDVTDAKHEAILPTDVHMWEALIGFFLERAGHVFPGMALDGVSGVHLRRNFKVTSVDGRQECVGRFVRSKATIRVISKDQEDPSASRQEQPQGELMLKPLPGLGAVVDQINECLGFFDGPFVFGSDSESCGLMLHGGQGTGKTFILEKLAALGWGRVFPIKPSDKLTGIRETLRQACEQRPSMVLIDDLDQLITPERQNRDAVIETICDTMDALSKEALTAQSLPQVLLVATCKDYLTSVPYTLRDLGRFYVNIMLPIPRTPQRLEILRNLHLPLPPADREDILHDISIKTHAFSPGDLVKLRHNAVHGTRRKMNRANWNRPKPNVDEENVQDEVSVKPRGILTREDMEHALRITQPSAMHDINLQPPIIHWKDVGGQEEVKEVLSDMIEYAKDPDPSALNIVSHPPKGLLLYGPPGCSKTLSAQAMATESGFNFFSVKAAEMLNMYVGESERAVRNLFERARNAAPAIIFFDEIDAIGGQRAGGASRGGSGTGGVNTVTTLLTEMDGFESLKGVIVIAATNRPESIDPALMRAGRFSEVVYVGPPDLAAREAIFRVHLRGKPLADDVDLHELAVKAEGHSGAEITHVCEQTCLVVQKRYSKDKSGAARLEITMDDLKDTLGKEQKAITSFMISDYERWGQQRKK